MYPEIKNKVAQSLNDLRVQVVFIIRFILNEMYPTIRNEVVRLFSDPNKRAVFLLVIALIVLLAFGIGDDHGT